MSAEAKEEVTVEVRAVFHFDDRRDYERWRRSSWPGVHVPAAATCTDYKEREVTGLVGEGTGVEGRDGSEQRTR